MASSRRYEVGVGCLVVVAAAVLVFLALQVGAIRGLGESVQVVVEIRDAAGLSRGAAVSVAGVEVGRVDNLGIDFDHARADVSLDAAAGLRRDVRVHVRARSVLGEKYLELEPVSRDAPLLADGDVLSDGGSQLEIDEMVGKFGPLLDAVDPAAIRTITSALTEDPERVKRILADAERAIHNLALASDELPALVRDTRATLVTVRRAAEEARPLLARLDGTIQRLDALVAAVPPGELPALIDEVQAAVSEGRAVLVKLDGATGGLQQLVDKANSVTREDILRMTQEGGGLIRLKPRKVEDVPPPSAGD